MSDAVFELDLFVEPEVLSKFIFNDDGLGLAGSIRFSTDGLSSGDLSVLDKQLKDVVVVEKDDQGNPVSAKVRVAFIKGGA